MWFQRLEKFSSKDNQRALNFVGNSIITGITDAYRIHSNRGQPRIEADHLYMPAQTGA